MPKKTTKAAASKTGNKFTTKVSVRKSKFIFYYITLYCIKLYYVPHTEAAPRETERPGRQKRGKSFDKHTGTCKFPISSH